MLRKYFPSKVFIADKDMEGYSMPICKGDECVMVDGKPWNLFDVAVTPRPYSCFGIEIFQPKDSECIIQEK